MDNAATVIIAGLGAFSMFLPPITDAASVELRRLRIGQGYASAATLAVGLLAAQSSNSYTPLAYAVVLIGMEIAAWEHARSDDSAINQ